MNHHQSTITDPENHGPLHPLGRHLYVPRVENGRVSVAVSSTALRVALYDALRCSLIANEIWLSARDLASVIRHVVAVRAGGPQTEYHPQAQIHRAPELLGELRGYLALLVADVRRDQPAELPDGLDWQPVPADQQTHPAWYTPDLGWPRIADQRTASGWTATLIRGIKTWLVHQPDGTFAGTAKI